METFSSPAELPVVPTQQGQYELQQDVTGKFEKKEPVILEDTRGNKLRSPWAPKKNCKRCYGRGYVGLNVATNEMIPCRKCYPWKR